MTTLKGRLVPLSVSHVWDTCLLTRPGSPPPPCAPPHTRNGRGERQSARGRLTQAIGSGRRSVTIAPVNVDPVVPVSSTVTYVPSIDASPGTRIVL